MASIEELEEAVKKLEAQLEKESAKTSAVEKELQTLQDEVSDIKKKMNDNDSSSTPKEEKPKTEKTIEKSPSQSDRKEKSSRREKSEKNLKESKSEDKEPEEKKEGEKKEKREKKEKKEKKNESESDFKMKMNENDKESKSMNIESTELSKSESQEKLKEKSEEKEPTIKPSGSSTEEGPAIVKSGYLEKKGAIRHNWLKRWFVLDAHERKLSYYDKKDAKDDAKGVVPLINATCYAHVEKKGVVKPLFFNVRTENRDFLIKAESKEDKDEWVKAIRAVCVKGDMPQDLKKHLNRSGNSFIGRTSEEVEAKKTPLPLGNQKT